jgi:DNA mismatch repair ATPase MutL
VRQSLSAEQPDKISPIRKKAGSIFINKRFMKSPRKEMTRSFWYSTEYQPFWLLSLQIDGSRFLAGRP